MKKSCTVEPGARVDLDDHDPDDTGSLRSEKEGKERLEALSEKLAKLQGLLYAENRHALLIILQGIDASGKDGTVRKVLSGLNPLGVTVTPFKAPNQEELEHDFLWRIHRYTPRRGDIAIFNRSHYEDVLVVRVHDLVPKKVWKTRYDQINEFERILVKNGTVVLKFFLHISKEEQKRRFEERLKDPEKYWKFSLADIEERKFWDDYMCAYEDALSRCSTKWAPWTIVPANCKWYRNIVVAEGIVKALEELDMKYPAATFDRSHVVID